MLIIGYNRIIKANWAAEAVWVLKTNRLVAGNGHDNHRKLEKLYTFGKVEPPLNPRPPPQALSRDQPKARAPSRPRAQRRAPSQNVCRHPGRCLEPSDPGVFIRMGDVVNGYLGVYMYYWNVYIPVSPVSRTACLSKNPGFQLKNLYFFKRAVLLRWDLLCNDNELDRCIHNTSHTIMEHVPSLLVLYYISYILLW